jgi:arginine/serine-rich splicing factor 12
MSFRIVQVTNVSSSVLKDQLRNLFATLGRIEEIQLYPESETLASTISSKVGYVKFERSESALAALNLTSTIFLDRPIICCLVKSSSSSSSSSSTRIPDEISALKFCPPINSNINLIPGGISWPYTIINRIVTVPGVGNAPSTSYIETVDPSLSSRSLPTYPTLPGTMDQAKAEEIRRTLYVSNLDPRITFENLHDLFNQVGEIRYIRMTTSINGIDYEDLGKFDEI